MYAAMRKRSLTLMVQGSFVALIASINKKIVTSQEGISFDETCEAGDIGIGK